MIKAGRAAVKLLLRIQWLLTAPQGFIARLFPKKPSQPGGYIFSQTVLKGQRLFGARAEMTSCEVVAVYNALKYLGIPASYESVRSAFLGSGALSLFFLGFLGGNPYSLVRVLRRFGVDAKACKPDDAGKACILSFFNPGSLSIHTVFCERRGEELFAYNYHPGDRGVRRVKVGAGEVVEAVEVG